MVNKYTLKEFQYGRAKKPYGILRNGKVIARFDSEKSAKSWLKYLKKYFRFHNPDKNTFKWRTRS